MQMHEDDLPLNLRKQFRRQNLVSIITITAFDIEYEVLFYGKCNIDIQFPLSDSLTLEKIDNILKEVNENKKELIEILEFLAQTDYHIIQEIKFENIQLHDWLIAYEKIFSNRFFDTFCLDHFNQVATRVREYFFPNHKPKKNKVSYSFLYLMRNNRNGYIKIGYSNDPKYRETTLQAEEPEVELIFQIKTSIKEELALHEKYAAKRLRGEWFDLNIQEIQETIQYLLTKEVK